MPGVNWGKVPTPKAYTELRHKTWHLVTASLSLPLVTKSPVQQPINSYSANELYLPTTSSETPLSTISIIPLVISKKEIAMREKQVKIAQEYKREAEGRFRAGVGSMIDIHRAEYFILSNQIQLLQAKQLLQLKQQQEKKKNSLTKT